MFWVIRGTDSRTSQDFEMVVEATCGAGAEMWAIKRNIPYVIIARAGNDDINRARENKRLWRYTPEPKYRCFGRPVYAKQLACLLIAGLSTIGFILSRTTPLPKMLARTMLTKDTRPAPHNNHGKQRTLSFAPQFETT
jgi:hypothetical protein